MNSRSTQRRIVDDPPPRAEVVTFKRKWPKPLPAIVADAIANNRAVIARLKLGIYGPDPENTSHYEEVFNKVCRCTDEQIKALEAFASIDWR
jgi:hypothetical protein